jgi:hypothetical protein
MFSVKRRFADDAELNSIHPVNSACLAKKFEPVHIGSHYFPAGNRSRHWPKSICRLSVDTMYCADVC